MPTAQFLLGKITSGKFSIPPGYDGKIHPPGKRLKLILICKVYNTYVEIPVVPSPIFHKLM